MIMLMDVEQITELLNKFIIQCLIENFDTNLCTLSTNIAREGIKVMHILEPEFLELDIVFI